jgi:hypothetical protein
MDCHQEIDWALGIISIIRKRADLREPFFDNPTEFNYPKE